MKIESGRGVASGAGARRAAAAAPGFAPAIDAPQAAAATTPATAIASLDALLALQAAPDPAGRRQRQVRRGGAALDALDDLMRGLALGAAPASVRGQLLSLRGEAEATGDAALDAVLMEIDIRVEVELAKLEKETGRV